MQRAHVRRADQDLPTNSLRSLNTHSLHCVNVIPGHTRTHTLSPQWKDRDDRLISSSALWLLCDVPFVSGRCSSSCVFLRLLVAGGAPPNRIPAHICVRRPQVSSCLFHQTGCPLTTRDSLCFTCVFFLCRNGSRVCGR